MFRVVGFAARFLVNIGFSVLVTTSHVALKRSLCDMRVIARGEAGPVRAGADSSL